MHKGARRDYDYESIPKTLVNIAPVALLSAICLNWTVILSPPVVRYGISDFFALYVAHPPTHITVTVRRHREPDTTRYRATVMQLYEIVNTHAAVLIRRRV